MISVLSTVCSVEHSVQWVVGYMVTMAHSKPLYCLPHSDRVHACGLECLGMEPIIAGLWGYTVLHLWPRIHSAYVVYLTHGLFWYVSVWGLRSSFVSTTIWVVYTRFLVYTTQDSASIQNTIGKYVCLAVFNNPYHRCPAQPLWPTKPSNNCDSWGPNEYIMRSEPMITVWKNNCWAIGDKCWHTDLAWERKWPINTGTQDVLTYIT